MPLIDSHAHLEMSAFALDREEVLSRARDAGVEFILAIGNAGPEAGSMEQALELCQRHRWLATTAGLHPHDARLASESWWRRILDLCRQPAVWAIGEIGLDYHYDHSPRDVQRAVFRDSLILARELDRPVIVHSREAEEDTLAILARHWAPPHPGGIMHCFSGNAAMANRCLELGFFISFAGPVTYPKAEELRHAVRAVPAGRLLAETDCPYLAPQAWRGKRNEPAYVLAVVEKLAELKEITPAQMAAATVSNFKNLFAKGFSR